MFAQVHFPVSLLPQELDNYLANGWFRMGETVFTTNFLSFHSLFYSAVWLRIRLPDLKKDRAFEKLQKTNSHFRVEIAPAVISEVHETLFSRYRTTVSFEASASLHDLLHGDAQNRIFPTWMVNVYDADRLIASGIFDLGKNSAAGITSFYDGEYKKYSLGRYLIYLKIAFCQQEGLTHFYPGYFVPGYKPFDYKLSIGTQTLEYLDLTSGNWISIQNFEHAQVPIEQMKQKLTVLEQHLKHLEVESLLFFYEFHGANLISDLQGFQLFDYPVFLHSPHMAGEKSGLVVVYDVREMKYQILHCYSIWKSDEPQAGKDKYEGHLLKVQQKVFSAESPKKVVDVLLSVKFSA